MLESVMLSVLGVLVVAFGAVVFWTTRQMWRTNVETLPSERAREARLMVGVGLTLGLVVFVLSLADKHQIAVAVVVFILVASFCIGPAVRLGRVVRGGRNRHD